MRWTKAVRKRLAVVVVRYGDNPLQAIKNVKAKIAEIAPGLPKKILPDGTVSQLTVVPFYDRTGLIYETLDTLNSALVCNKFWSLRLW
ncbi:MAG: hypothetical protein R3C26_11765 [Calditrichia bacterium]